MFDFIKQFLSPKHEEVELTKTSLSGFIKQKHIDLVDELVSELKNESEHFDSLVNTVDEKIKALADAQLKNTKIPTRAKQMMEGNRRAYIRRIERFVDKFSLPDISSELSIKNIQDFSESFEKELENITKSTQKSYAVLQEFLANESRDLAHSVKAIRDHLRTITNKIQNSGYDQSLKAIQLIDEIENEKKAKKAQKESLKIAKEKEKETKTLLNNIKSKQEEIKKSSQYQEFLNLQHKIKETESDIYKHKLNFSQPFHVLEHALKKYQRLSLQQELIGKYINSAPDAALEDKENKILEVLQKMESALEDDTLSIKEKKKEKTLQNLKIISKGYLDEYRMRISNLKKSQSNSQAKLRNNSSKDKIEETSKSIAKTHDHLKSQQNEIKKLQQSIDQGNLDTLYENAASAAKSAYNVEIVLK